MEELNVFKKTNIQIFSKKIFFFLVIILSLSFFSCALVFEKINEPKKMDFSMNSKKLPSIQCEINVSYKLNKNWNNDNNGKVLYNEKKYLNSIPNSINNSELANVWNPNLSSQPDYSCHIQIDQNASFYGTIFGMIFPSLTLLIIPGIKPMRDYITVDFYDVKGKEMRRKTKEISYRVYASIFFVLTIWYDYEIKREKLYTSLLTQIFKEFFTELSEPRKN